MNQIIRSNKTDAHQVEIRSAIEAQRQMLTERFTRRMYKISKRLHSIMNQRTELEELLVFEIQRLKICKFLYVLDERGVQITSTISRSSIYSEQHLRNRAERDYMQDIIGVSDFRLSEVYVSKNNKRPSITAIQVIRDEDRKLIGFLGADFDLRELPHTGAIYKDINRWHQLRGDPAIRSGLFNQIRTHSLIDQHIDEVMILLFELMTERGVFQSQLHFSSNRAVLWLEEDPFNYRLIGGDELINPDLCLAYKPQDYPKDAMVPCEKIMEILESCKALRMMDENIYLRSVSINIFNGIVSLNFSCDGTHYMGYQEFLKKNLNFWIGHKCNP